MVIGKDFSRIAGRNADAPYRRGRTRAREVERALASVVNQEHFGDDFQKRENSRKRGGLLVWQTTRTPARIKHRQSVARISSWSGRMSTVVFSLQDTPVITSSTS
jgi:hypothetical protein